MSKDWDDMKVYSSKKSLILIAVASLLLAGCGDDGGKGGASASDSAQSIASSAPKSASAPSESQKPVGHPGDSCADVECAAGSNAITTMSKGEVYYACPSLSLAKYTNTVVAFTTLQLVATGKLPNISPDTGEPEFSGETKDIVDSLQTGANVDTFGQAVSECVKGSNKIKVTIMNNGDDDTVVWVEAANNTSFWIPKEYLNRR